MKTWKDKIHFVLVEPKESGNIGASARAMKNMGFKNLCLVNPPPVITDEAQRFAHNSLDVLEGAKVYNSLADALEDKTLVVGVARRAGKRRGLSLPLDKGVEKLCDALPENKIALLFGREDRGLYNDEVGECGLLLTIPANKAHPSLNLSHAVMVVAYELSKLHCSEEGLGAAQGKTRKRERLIGHGELTFLFERIAETLILLDYLPRGDRDIQRQIMENLKHFVGRSGITDWELKMLHGICSQIDRKLGKE